MAVREFTVEEFARLWGRTPRYVAQCCQGRTTQLSNRKPQTRNLPPGFAVFRVPGPGSPNGQWRIIGDEDAIPRDQPLTIYALQEQRGTDYSIKIGSTSEAEPDKSRFLNLRSGNWRDPRLVARLIGTRQIERELHERFAHHRINLEWFHAHPELISYLHQIRRDFPELQPPTEPRLP